MQIARSNSRRFKIYNFRTVSLLSSKKNKKEIININKTIDKDNIRRPKIKDDEEYDEKKAFITGIPEN